MTDHPILNMNGEIDERSPSVVLLEKGDQDKMTAEDRGEYFWIADWELHEMDGQTYWFERSGYSISRDLVERLHSIPRRIDNA